MNSTNIIDSYIGRASIAQTVEGFKLTLDSITQSDEGRYKVASSTVRLSRSCINESYHLTVLAEMSDEHMEPWSAWSFCINQCSSHTKRSRSRQCNVKDGCVNMGSTYQIETCDKAVHCPKWSDWGQWGYCSAKCGKGFKIRTRVCLNISNGRSSLIHSAECPGMPTQSHMCLTVCEVVGTWSEWSEWTVCTQPCGNDVMVRGTRTRVRSCSTHGGQHLVTEHCYGNKTEADTCGASDCIESFENSTVAFTVGGSVSESHVTGAVGITGVSDGGTGHGLGIVYMVAGSACAVTVLVILIVVIVLKKRVRRRNSAPTLRPADSANNRREKKRSKERRSGTPDVTSGTGSGNFYSELSSSFCYPSSEFDSTYSIENNGFTRPSIVNSLAAIQDNDGDLEGIDGYDSEFDDNPDVTKREIMCERKEIIYETSRVSCQRTHSEEDRTRYDENQSTRPEDYEVITENESYEPPDLWSNDDVRLSFAHQGDDSICCIENKDSEAQRFNNTETIYYEPPVDDSPSKRAEMKRQESEIPEESIYENYEINNGTLKALSENRLSYDENSWYEIPESCNCTMESKTESNNVTSDTEKVNRDSYEAIPNFNQVNMRNGSVVTIERCPDFSNEDLDTDHIYVNERMRSDVSDYAIPRNVLGIPGIQDMAEPDSEHIYDIPKFCK